MHIRYFSIKKDVDRWKYIVLASHFQCRQCDREKDSYTLLLNLNVYPERNLLGVSSPGKPAD